MVTVRQVYALSLAKLFEKPNSDKDFEYAFPLLLSQILMQILPNENQIRRVEGKTIMLPDDVPFYDAITDDTIPFDVRVMRGAVPDGIAGLFMADDDSKKTEAVLQRNLFVQQLNSLTPARQEVTE